MYTYRLTLESIYDGDTLDGIVDLGFNLKMDIKIRLARIDTPELRTKDLDEKARGYAARDFLRELLDKYKDSLCVRTVEKGKYGRWIGEILIDLSKHEWDSDIVDEAPGGPFEQYFNVNDLLVRKGHAIYKEY